MLLSDILSLALSWPLKALSIRVLSAWISDLWLTLNMTVALTVLGSNIHLIFLIRWLS